MKNQPEIRIGGFEGEWEDVQFSELVDRVSNRADNSFDLPRVEYEDIISGKGTLRSDFFDKQSSKDGILFEPGDVLYGKLRPYLKNWILADFDGIAVGDFWVLRGVKVTPTFLFQLIQSERFAGLAKMTTGTKMPRADWSVMGSATYEVPTNPEEQKAIGNFFADLDTTITESTTKIEKLKNLRATMLVKMFPQGSSKVPEIRLGGFDGEWVSEVFGEFSSVAMNKRVFNHQTSPKGDVPFFKIGTFGKKPDAFISRELYDEYRSQYPHPEKGAVLISAAGSIGRTVVYDGTDAYFQDSNIVWVNHDGRVLNEYLQYFFEIIKWSGLEGTTIKRLYNSNILDTACTYPTLEEQRAIGTFFRELDELIDAEELKLTKLSNLKNTFLTKMFV